MKLVLMITLPLCLLLSGCEEYMWRKNLKQLKQLDQQGQLPKLNTDREIRGQDTNQNGIRDDVDLYIGRNFQQIEQRQAVEQFAMALQTSLLLDLSKQSFVREIAYEKSRAIGCIYERFPADESPQASGVIYNTIAVSANTKVRFNAYLAFSKALDGSAMTLPSHDLCQDENTK